MTAEYREVELANAKTELTAARERMNAAGGRKAAWRAAESDLNFWQSKVAFLSQAR